MKRLRTALRRDDGITVIELMIGIAMISLLVVSALSIVDSATRAEHGQRVRQDALLDARAAMTRMTKDVRQAISIDPSSNASRLTMSTLVSGAQHQIVYVNSGSAITRAVDGGTAETLVDSVATSQTFCYLFITACEATTPSVDVSSIRITVKVTPTQTGAAPVTLATDVELRNI